MLHAPRPPKETKKKGGGEVLIDYSVLCFSFTFQNSEPRLAHFLNKENRAMKLFMSVP